MPLKEMSNLERLTGGGGGMELIDGDAGDNSQEGKDFSLIL